MTRVMPAPTRSQHHEIGAPTWRYADRREGGHRLAAALASYAHKPGVVVLALPRGGVPVGYEVARALEAPLDVFMVRKLGFPGHPELAMGAIASGGSYVLNEDLVRRSGVSQEVLAQVAERELEEIERREHEYRGVRPALDPRGLEVILVDDGLATGATMRAAILALRQQSPARVVVAIPVAAPDSCEELGEVADEVVCPVRPRRLRAIGLWYEDFAQITDAQVRDFLTA